jgi:hypothetical protein
MDANAFTAGHHAHSRHFGRKSRWLLSGSGILLLLVALAPTLLVRAPVVNRAARWLLPGLQGHMKVGKASIGWFTPLELSDLTVCDGTGRPLLEVSRIVGNRSLFELLRDRSGLGTLRCEQASVHILCTGTHSNLEQVLTSLSDTDDFRTAQPWELRVEVVDARVQVEDEDTKKHWTISPVTATLTLGHAAKLHANVEAVPLAALSPVLRRFDSSVVLDGQLGGQLDCQYESDDAGQPRLDVQGRLTARELVASAAARGPLAWPEPISIDFSAHRIGEMFPVLDRCRCESGLLAVSASGSLDQVTLTGSGDLGQLSERLARVVDLGPLHLAGQGTTTLTLRRSAAGVVDLVGDVQARQLEVAGLSRLPLKEDDVTLHLEAAAVLSPSGFPSRIERALVRLQAGTDQLLVQLLEPMTDLSLSLTAAGELRLSGDLTRWQRRLQPLFDLTDWQTAGAVDLATHWHLLTDAVEFDSLHLGLRDLHVQAAGFNVTEPALDLKSAGRWEGATGRVEMRDTVLTTSKVALQVPRVEWTAGTSSLVLEHAKISRELCDQFLGYAVPVLAGAAQAEGEVSLTLESCRLPAAAGEQAEMSGRLTIHRAQVSGSPLVREVATLLKGSPTLTLMRDSVVSFHLVNGRVHHQDLQLVFPEVTVRTSGSVGLDGSLDLVAELRVPAKWVGDGRLGVAAGKTIRVPVRGSLAHPQLDQQALRAEGIQFLRDTMRNEAEKKLDRLLRRP